MHGKHSGGVSKNMELPVMAEQAMLKGLHILGTADVLHRAWLEHVKANIVEESNGIFKHKKFDTNFIIQTEVECSDHVHHVILLPDLASAESLREKMLPHGKIDSEGFGRPKLHCNAEFIAQSVDEVGGIIGPAHAFTPYFSIYAHFNRPEEVYKSMADKIYFMELGLSADSYFADLMKEDWNYSFLTNSDAHSPWPFRMGREFTRFKLKEPSFKEIKKALKEKEDKKIVLNAGLDPREGKYHRTACNICYTKYSADQALQFKWRCPKCKGAIKKGVKERIIELADYKEEKHPSFRPPYLHIITLAEIIQLSLGKREPNNKEVQQKWKDLVERFDNEINVLIDVKIDELKEADKKTAEFVDAFRKGFVVYEEGGGGLYGKPSISMNEKDFGIAKKKIAEGETKIADFSGQKTLSEF